MDIGSFDRLFNGLPPKIIYDTNNADLGSFARWLNGLPPIIEYGQTSAGGITVYPSTLTLTLTRNASTVVIPITITPSALTLTLALPEPTPIAPQNCTIEADTFGLTLALKTPTEKYDMVVSPTTLSLTLSLEHIGFIPGPAVRTLALSLQTPSVVYDRSYIVPAPLELFLNLGTPTVKGGRTYLTFSPTLSRIEYYVDGTMIAYMDTNGHLYVLDGIGVGTTDIPVYSVDGRRYVCVSGSSGCGGVEFTTQQADAEGNCVGTVQWVDKNSVALSDKRVAAISTFLQGTTPSDRGGYLAFCVKENGVEGLVARAAFTEDNHFYLKAGMKIRPGSASTTSIAVTDHNGTSYYWWDSVYKRFGQSIQTISSAYSIGTAGEICWDADYIYVCYSQNQWRRVALSNF